MKSVEKVLLAIKMECDKQTNLAEINCFDKVAGKAGVPCEKLSLYLDELRERGYIKYSLVDRYIYLTKEGRAYVA